VSIITISRESYSRGREVALRAADMLGYRCVAREVVAEASREFHIPEIRLVRAIHDAPSVFEKLTHGKEKYIACFKAALLKQLRGDNVVYHGLGGYFFAKGLKNALKVRIYADTEDRVNLAMERNNVPRTEALRILKADDQERRRWGRSLFGMDITDPGLYDMVIHLGKLSVEDAASLVSRVAGMERFQTTTESRKAVENLALAAEVKATLLEIKPDAKVYADEGRVYVGARLPFSDGKRGLVEEMKKLVRAVPGVKMVDVKPLRLTGKMHHFPVGPNFPAGGWY
jgi:cytidylate kinase